MQGKTVDKPDRSVEHQQGQNLEEVERVAQRILLLHEGQYATQLFQDNNGNGQLDHSRRGIPLEPVGFSGNPPLVNGKPAP